MTDLLIKVGTQKPPFKVKYLSNGTRYAITCNPNPSLYKGATDPLDQVRATLPKILKFFQPIGQISLQIEMTLMGNIHYHGFLFVVDGVKYGKTMGNFQKHHCALTIKTCPSPGAWIEYIMKERDDMMAILGEPDIYDQDPMSQYYNYVTPDSYGKWELSYKKKQLLKISSIEDYIFNKYTGEPWPEQKDDIDALD